MIGEYALLRSVPSTDRPSFWVVIRERRRPLKEIGVRKVALTTFFRPPAYRGCKRGAGGPVLPEERPRTREGVHTVRIVSLSVSSNKCVLPLLLGVLLTIGCDVGGDEAAADNRCTHRPPPTAIVNPFTAARRLAGLCSLRWSRSSSRSASRHGRPHSRAPPSTTSFDERRRRRRRGRRRLLLIC